MTRAFDSSTQWAGVGQISLKSRPTRALYQDPVLKRKQNKSKQNKQTKNLSKQQGGVCPRALAAKPDDLSSISKLHMEEGEN